MGEVYRARDTRLKREVALKVVSDSFTTDPDRLARFQREAEMLAALSYGLGYMIFAARSYMDVSTMFVGIVCLAVIGLLIEHVIFGTLEKMTVARWHSSGKVRGAR